MMATDLMMATNLATIMAGCKYTQTGSSRMLLVPRQQLKAWNSLVLVLFGLVHVTAPASFMSAAAKSKTPTGQTTQQPNSAPQKPAAQPADVTLPRPVQDMVDAIMTAVRSGRIEDMRDALEWNELKPELGPNPVPDPIAYWKALSKDGLGHEVLDALGTLLETMPTVVPYGRDLENNRLFVWPHFVDRPLSSLRGPDADLLNKLVPGDVIETMKAQDRYSGWRLVIGPDGTWHSFRSGK
jgi:hypothetical protein